MGTARVDHMLMVLAVSLDMDAKEREVITREMIRGFNDTAEEAGTAITGGQSILNPWPIIGGVANTVVKKDEFLVPNRAQVGDVIVLTKPLGTQIAVNLKEWKSKNNDKYKKALKLGIVTSDDVEEINKVAIHSMGKLNKNAAGLVNKYKSGACTDVTGFGILGHLENLAEAQSSDGLELRINKLPVLKNSDKIEESIMNFNLVKGYSAETSGGLMAFLKEKDVKDFQNELEVKYGEKSWVIGEVRERKEGNKATIAKDVEVIYADSVF
mmetsp:Transcript_25526/g.25319  ORF Transcript_25526/g.25319 Transcript_25526/m.25319 type:complete len:269 (+) Transcript_25526:383-1189(+)